MRKFALFVALLIVLSGIPCQGQVHSPACPPGTQPYVVTRDPADKLHDEECLDLLTGRLSFTSLRLTPGLGGTVTFPDGSVQHVAATSEDQGARVYNSTAPSISNNVPTVLSFDSARWNDGGVYSAGNPTRLTAQVAGKYVISATVSWAANTTGLRNVSLRVDGSNYIAEQQAAAGSTSVSKSANRSLRKNALM